LREGKRTNKQKELLNLFLSEAQYLAMMLFVLAEDRRRFKGFFIMKIPQRDLLKISQKTNGRCFYCNSRGTSEVDHFISKKKWKEWKLDDSPIKGQLYNLDNLFLSCQKCNRSKKDKCPENFMGSSHKAWSRYFRANHRIGINLEISREEIKLWE
jgi:5-methylcytosine-specific restriction endonuclease McrA